MKDNVAVSGTRRPISARLKTALYPSLLVLASILALAGGTETSVLFFGLVLTFSLLVLVSRSLSTRAPQAGHDTRQCSTRTGRASLAKNGRAFSGPTVFFAQRHTLPARIRVRSQSGKIEREFQRDQEKSQ